MKDQQIFDIIRRERERQTKGIELIASENYVSDQVLEAMGSVTDSTKYFINHFSHNGQATHAELEAYYDPYGIQVAYDGLTVKF